MTATASHVSGRLVAAGYARVSTTDQSREGVSLDAQADRIGRYCDAHGLTLAHVYIDAAVSGGIPLGARPEGATMLAALGREVTTVVAFKLDRLFRSTLDCLETVQRWDRQRIGLHLIDFNGAQLDTRSAMGRLMLTMGAAFAEMERSLIGERTSAALQHMKRQGVRLGGVPYGFRATIPGGPLVPDADELATVREILRLRGPGDTQASYRAIGRHLDRAGIPTRHGGAWKAETVRRIVARTALYGAAGVNATSVPLTVQDRTTPTETSSTAERILPQSSSHSRLAILNNRVVNGREA